MQTIPESHEAASELSSEGGRQKEKRARRSVGVKIMQTIPESHEAASELSPGTESQESETGTSVGKVARDTPGSDADLSAPASETEQVNPSLKRSKGMPRKRKYDEVEECDLKDSGGNGEEGKALMMSLADVVKTKQRRARCRAKDSLS